METMRMSVRALPFLLTMLSCMALPMLKSYIGIIMLCFALEN